MTDDALSYPIGRFHTPAQVSDTELAAAIEAVAELPAALRAAVAGLTAGQLDTAYRPGGWTLAQVVHHLADSHMHAYLRTKFAFTEDQPAIRAYDEQAWAMLPDVAGVAPEVSLALVEGIHARWVHCLRGMPAAAFARTFVHPELGPQRVDVNMVRYAWHGRHHVAHITGLRARAGW